MTKRHFIALAEAIKVHNRCKGIHAFDFGHLDTLADFCAAQNPQFNRARWLGYIAGTNGPNGGKGKR